MIYKNLLILAFAFLTIGTSFSQSASDSVFMYSYFKGNGEDGLHLASSTDGFKWEALNNDQSFLTPTAGGDKLMRDPCIIRGGDGKFHMVWTVSWNEKGIGYASSDDLINWSKQKFIPVMEHEDKARNCWAPEVFYDTQKDLYMIYWATTITGLYPETQSTEDVSYNHRMYYVTTKDFKKFSKTKLLIEPGFNVIDASIIKEGNEYVMFIKDETKVPPQKNIKVIRSNKLMKDYSSAGDPITGDYWAEGPSAAKVNGKWVVYFDKYTEKQMGAVASADLVNWTDISNKIDFPEGTRHGTVFKISREEFEKLKGK